jgi:hypothetical protein
MRTSILVLFTAVFLPLLCSCSSGPVYLSQWQSKTVVVDGDASDWQRPFAYYDQDSKLNYTISNDSTKLYLCMEAFDEPTQTKIIRGGLQLWIDTDGGKDQQIGILYPVSSTMPPTPRAYGSRNSEPPDYDPIGALRRSFLRSQSEIELSGFKSPIGGLVPLQNAFGIEVRINWDTLNNVLNYEAAIPFSTFYRHSLSSVDSLKTFGVKFVVNGVGKQHTATEHQGDDGGISGGMPGDGGMGGGTGYPGGGYPGGGSPGGMGGMGGGSMGHSGGHRGGGHNTETTHNPLAESTSFWIKLRLAMRAGS